MIADGRRLGGFGRILLGQAASLLSSSAAQFALIWWVTVRTGSALALGAAALAGFLPQALLGPIAGALIDRGSARRVMIAADFVSAAAASALAAAFASGTGSVWPVYLALLVRAGAEAFQRPAFQAFTAELVPPESLVKAGGLSQAAAALSSLAGPAFGAVMAASLAIPAVMAVDAGGAVFAALMARGVRRSDASLRPDRSAVIDDAGDGAGTPSSGRAGFGSAASALYVELKAGFRFLASDPEFRAMAVPAVLAGMLFMPLGALLPLLVRQRFHGGAWHTGLAQSLFFLGMLGSGALQGVRGALGRPAAVVAASAAALGLSLAAAGLAPSSAFWLFCVAIFAAGVSGGIGNVPVIARLQAAAPPELRGKALAAAGTLLGAGLPLGLGIASPVAERYGVSPWAVLGGASLAATGLIAAFRARRRAAGAAAGYGRPGLR